MEMANIDKLRGKIVENKMSIEELSNLIGVHPSTFYRKMDKEGISFTIGEAKAISLALKLTTSEVNDIFFNDFVA